MSKYIPLSVPNLKGNELKYVTHAIETEWVSTSGSYVNDFEKMIADYVGAPGAVSCQNGTSGLHIAILLCGIKPGDEVIVPTLTFIAAVNPVKYAGAEPVFMDCDDSLTMDPDKLAEFCRNECDFTDGRLINKITGRHISALIVVHVFGNMADMVHIMPIARLYNLKVIEDATEALGTYYTAGPLTGKHAGTVGDVGVYSFNGNKIITTGGGGMIVSNDASLLKEAKHLTTQAKSDEHFFLHDEVGYNYRLTNLQAAMGLAQMEQLETFIQTKHDNYQLYRLYIENIKGLKLHDVRPDIRSNRWFYALECGPDYRLNRDQIIKCLGEKDVQARPVWGLISDQKPYAACQSYKIEKARYYLDCIVNVPCSTNLSSDDVLYIVECLREFNNEVAHG